MPVLPMAGLSLCEVIRMNKSIALRRYDLRGGVDVNMYNTLLEPDFALNVDADTMTAEEEKAVRDRFDINAYRSKVLEIAIPLLEQQLRLLPERLNIRLVPGSAFIYSPHDYSYGGDELHFAIEARTDLSNAEMQALLDDAVREDWDAEFGAHYRISEDLGENYTIYDFLRPEGGDSE